MSEPQTPLKNKKTVEGWAPYDYSDGRQLGEWTSIYPKEARWGIRFETWYLVLWTIGYVGCVFYLLYQLYWNSDGPVGASNTDKNKIVFCGFVSAWIGGSLGGFTFGIKWMYHSVAKELWHVDRRLWRLLTPHLSAIVSLFMVFLVCSGLLQIFDNKFIERPVAILAFSFLVGYFSDKALAKMAEVADTLFGSQKRGIKSDTLRSKAATKNE